MTARHARVDEFGTSPSLRLVDDDPRDPEFAPEVRAVLDAVAGLHAALISWAATTGADHEPQRRGRHRR